MRPMMKTVVMAVGLLTCLSGLDRAKLFGAEEETRFSHSRRGGILVSTEGHRFDIFFYANGVRVFPLDDAGNAIDTSRLTASATFYHPRTPREPWFSRPLHPDLSDPGNAPSSLDLSMGLAKVPEKTTMVAFEIVGLPGPTASTSTFKVPLEFVAKAAAPEADMSSEPLRIASTGYDVNRPDVVSGPSALPEPAQATPADAGTPKTAGGNTSTNSTTANLKRRDWTTGRSNLPLAKPWLPPKG